MYHKLLRLVIAICLFLLCFSLPLFAQDAPQPLPVGLRADAPAYAVHGPYWVGTQEFVVEPDADQPLDITVWYPALNPTGTEESVIYAIKRVNLIVDITQPDTQLTSLGHALANAAPDPSGGPYPVVIYSHGFTAWRQAYNFLPEHLASWGFIVIAPEHLGEVPSGGLEMHWPNYFTRPMDISRSLDYAETSLNASGAMAGLLDLEHVAVTGHSFGGWTAIVEAGALMNTATWTEWCANAPNAAENEDCQLLPYMDRGAELLGLESVPEGLWPAMNDPRVDAVIADAAGTTFMFGSEGYSAVEIPTMVIFGDADEGVGALENGGYTIYQQISSLQKASVRFQNAGHFIFVDECPTMMWAVDMGLEFLCTDPVWDMDRAHDLINHFSTAFLLDTLKGDADAHAALAPNNVNFTGITYQAEGF